MMCEELPPDGILLIYLSASGRGGQVQLGAGAHIDSTENIVRDFQSHTHFTNETCSLPFTSASSRLNPSTKQSEGDCTSYHTGCLQFGNRGASGSNFLYPCDLIPFTRRPLFIVIDSDSSEAFRVIYGAEKGEPVAMLLSPSSSPPIALGAESARHPSGNLFTIFLTAPLQAFCLLLGYSGSDIEMDVYNKADKLLSSSFDGWGTTLATSDSIAPVWAQVLNDPFLRRLLLRFIFCETVLALYSPIFNKKEFLPQCVPCLPESILPTTSTSQAAILQLATIFNAANRFSFSEEITTPDIIHSDVDSVAVS